MKQNGFFRQPVKGCLETPIPSLTRPRLDLIQQASDFLDPAPELPGIVDNPGLAEGVHFVQNGPNSPDFSRLNGVGRRS